MIEPALGFDAMMSAATEIPRTTIRPVHIISLSLALPFLMTGLYTSLENADEAASSWLSAVLMEAASTAERSIPEITPGKIFLTIWMKTREFSLIDSSKPRKSLPITPIKVARVHVIPIFADFFKSFCDLMDMNLMMICGIPK